MRSFFPSLRSFSCSLSLVTLALATNPAAASDDPTKAVSAAAPTKSAGSASVAGTAMTTLMTTSSVNANRLAYVMAWRNAQEADEHTDALRITQALAERIGLAVTDEAYTVLSRFLDGALAGNPGRFATYEEPQEVLHQLLREDLGGFQRTLSPVLSETSYERYQSLLNELKIPTR